jgi:hypothetical protein
VKCAALPETSLVHRYASLTSIFPPTFPASLWKASNWRWTSASFSSRFVVYLR